VYFLEFGLLMPVFSSYSAQLSSIIVLSLLHYIMMHMYQLSFILVDWLWPIFVGSEERNQWFTSFVPLQNVVHVTLLPPYIVRKWLYKQYELFCLTRNGAEKYGRFSTDSHNSVIFLGVLVSKDQEIKKKHIFFAFSSAMLGPKISWKPFILDWFVCQCYGPYGQYWQNPDACQLLTSPSSI